MKPRFWQLGFIAQSVEQLHRYCRGHGFKSYWSLRIFSGLYLLRYVHNNITKLTNNTGHTVYCPHPLKKKKQKQKTPTLKQVLDQLKSFLVTIIRSFTGAIGLFQCRLRLKNTTNFRKKGKQKQTKNTVLPDWVQTYIQLWK